ncbi:phospholipase [Streptomyces formicae]|uniref:Secreted protein n=1 Tax=Streptomyces formicae TaxID=1616117 RepID=A0A291Q1R5_9ACTN|nr:phospholipase [Streptomyces formicae]ATL25680.1 secreted protein [Streptomyces formicae]
MRSRILMSAVAAGAALAASLGSAIPAQAAPADKPQVLSSWTQTSASSYAAWNSARQNQGNWAAYGFDWSTDYCTTSPDNPYGYPFKMSCARHDFGYRNYKAAGQFAANKDRIDSAFYADLKRVCAGYSGDSRTECESLAKVYYEAVRILGVKQQEHAQAA